MATQADVRRIALALPQAEEADGHFAFSVPTKGKLKGFAWVWMERVTPKKPRVANPGVLAIRVASIAERGAMISADLLADGKPIRRATRKRRSTKR